MQDFQKQLAELASHIFPELAVVSDADRLDAIGGFGVARTFEYGASRPLYDPNYPIRTELTKEEYCKATKEPTINHFYEKLLKLSDMMYTDSAKEMAKSRHAFMESFVEQMHAEFKMCLI